MVIMNQRREARFGANQSVWVTLLGPVDTRIPGCIRNVASRGIGLEVGQAIDAGAALKIELPDSILLGEAIYCRKEKTGFYVGVELEQALHGLASLGEMLRQFAEETSSSHRTETVQDAGGENQQQRH